MSSEDAPDYRLYKLAALWGLPSASPSCVRVEVGLRRSSLLCGQVDDLEHHSGSQWCTCRPISAWQR